MAKQKKPAATTKARKARAVRPGLRMDGAAAKYAALLADPCNGDLVSGPFGDGTGGMVCRFEKEYVINNSPTDTACAFIFHPYSGLVAWTNALANDTDPYTLSIPTGSASHPGQTFLSVNAGWVRCIAACVQVYYPGSELSRAGVVSLGRYPAEIANDTSVAVAMLRTQANYVMRTPSDVAEIVWRPTEFDLTGREPLAVGAYASTSMATQNTTCLAVTGAGLPVSTGLRIRVVAVYEWQPDPMSGFKNTIVRNPSPVRLADILARLDATGDWMSGAARSAGKAISSLAHGVASVYQLGNGAARIGRALLA